LADGDEMTRARALRAVGLLCCLGLACGPAILELPPDLNVADVDLQGPEGDRVLQRIERLVEVDLAEQRLLEDRLNPLAPNATFPERVERLLDNAADAMFVARERAVAGNLTEEHLDQMVMSFTDVLAFEAAKRDPRAPRFVRSPALQARRRELDATLEEIRARRAQGLPDEPARDDAGLKREWRQPPPLQRATQPVVPQGRDDLDGIFED
jgi:hypothetical protein